MVCRRSNGFQARGSGAPWRTIYVSLEPVRLAVYSFAFVPWMRPHQRRINESLLPGTEAKFRLLATVVSTLTEAGYRSIGMDHFALPDDDLTIAQKEDRLDLRDPPTMSEVKAALDLLRDDVGR